MPAALAPLLELAGVRCDVLPCTGLDDPPPTGQAVPLAVNLHGSGPQSHRWLAALTPERLVAFGEPTTGVPGPRWDEAEHERARWCRLVSTELGVPCDPDDVLLPRLRHRPEQQGRRYAVVHPGAASGARRWPVERFATVVRALAADGLDVVLTGSPAEQPLVDLLVEQAGAGPAVVRAGRTDLRELAHLVAGARVLVCGDTGVAHLASATGTPSVVLFGPVSPGSWGPPSSGPHRALWHGRTGDPHAGTVDPGLLQITAEEVLAAVSEVVDQDLSRGRPAPSGSPGGTTGRRSASPAASPAGPPPAPR
jgi:ADP-heptose:LPS heptosyltransferase